MAEMEARANAMAAPVFIVLRGDSAACDVAMLQLATDRFEFRSEEEITPQDHALLLTVYPVHNDIFRCRFSLEDGTLLEERVIAPDELEKAAHSAWKKASGGVAVPLAIKDCEGLENTAFLHELRMRLVRSSGIVLCGKQESSYVIRLSASKEGLILSLFDADGQILWKSGKTIPLQNVKVITEKLLAKLHSEPYSDRYQPHQEAEMYLDDLHALFQNMKEPCDDSGEIPKKLEMIRFFGSDDPQMQYACLWYSLFPLHEKNLSREEKEKLAGSFVISAEKFLEKFPGFEYPAMPSGDAAPFAGYPSLSFDPLNIPEAEAIRNWRQKTFHPPKTVRVPGLPANADRKAFLAWRETLYIQTKELPGVDSASLADIRFEYQIRLLEETIRFIRKNPSESAGVQLKHFIFPYDTFPPIARRKAFWNEACSLLRTRGKELIARAEQLNTPEGKMYAADIRAVYDWFRSDKSQSSLKSILSAKMDAQLQAGLQMKPGQVYGGFLRDVFPYEPPPFDGSTAQHILQVYPFEYVFQKADIPENLRILCMVEAGTHDAGFLIRNEAAIRSMAPRSFKNKVANSSFSILAESLYRRMKNDPEAEKAFYALNCAFAVRLIPSSGGSCVASCVADKTVFLLRRGKKEELSITGIEAESGRIAHNILLPVTFKQFQSSERIPGQPEACTITYSNGYLIACGERMVYLYDTAKKTGKLISGIPVPFPVCVVVSNGYLYMLTGGVPGVSGSDKAISLLSCRLDGTGMRVLVQNDPVMNRGRVSGFIPSAKGYLFSAFSTRHFANLCRFEPEKKMISIVEELSPKVHTFAVTGNHRNLSGQFGHAFFMARTENPQAKNWFFSNSAIESQKAKLTIPESAASGMPFVLADNRYFISASPRFSPLLIDLGNPAKSPLLLLPECTNAFYLPESGELAFPVLQDGTLCVVRFYGSQFLAEH